MLLVWTNKRTPGLRAEIELQVSPTPQLVKRGGDLTYTGPMEAGMIAGFLWFQGTFAQFLVLYKSWERRIFSQTF